MASADNSIIEMTPIMKTTSRNDEHKTPINELEESSSSVMSKHCGPCNKIGEFVQYFRNIPFKLKKFIFTEIGMTTADVVTDFYQACKHFL